MLSLVTDYFGQRDIFVIYLISFHLEKFEVAKLVIYLHF
jgi:hypothetical protein